MDNNVPSTLLKYWAQIALAIAVIRSIIIYYRGSRAREDKHKYDKSQTFNMDIDTLSDGYDLSQKMLSVMKTQLDETQASLDKANEAYSAIRIELTRAIDEIRAYKVKTDTLGGENKALINVNKDLIAKLHTCEFACKNKEFKMHKTNDLNLY